MKLMRFERLLPPQTYHVIARYLGEGQAQVESGQRTFILNQRTEIQKPEAYFCPVELILVSLGA